MPSAGDLLGNTYRLERRVGEGGMGAIWKATHLGIDQPVAVKLLNQRDPEEVECFLREAKLLAAVRHRNVVQVIDFGRTDPGDPYLVMEYLKGEDLGERLSRRPELAIPELVQILSAALRGLGAVHDAGIVHRDVKPENVFLVEDAEGLQPKIVDFGISRATKVSGLRSAVPTVTGMIVGTLPYMSPEQARGVKDIDLRTDLYSLGVVFYEALGGRLPFEDRNPADLLISILTKAPPTIASLRPDLGQPVADFVDRAVAKDRNARFQNARTMREALLDAADRTAAVSNTWVTATAPLLALDKLARSARVSEPTAIDLARITQASERTAPGEQATDPITLPVVEVTTAAPVAEVTAAAHPPQNPPLPSATSRPVRHLRALAFMAGAITVAAAIGWLATRGKAPAIKRGPEPVASPASTPPSASDPPPTSVADAGQVTQPETPAGEAPTPAPTQPGEPRNRRRGADGRQPARPADPVPARVDTPPPPRADRSGTRLGLPIETNLGF